MKFRIFGISLILSKRHTVSESSGARAIALHAAVALLSLSAMFLCRHGFVEAETLPKWYAFIAGSALYGTLSLALTRRARIAVGPIAVLLILFAGYLFVRMLRSGPAGDLPSLSLAAFVLLYFSFRWTPGRNLSRIGEVIVAVCVLQASYGLMQYAGILPSGRGFRMVGSFDNPAGFAACLTAGFPFCFPLFRGGRRTRRLGFASAAILAAAVILCGSRAGILAMTVAGAVYAGNRYSGFLGRHRRYIYLSLGVFVLSAVGLFLLKKDSALGRIPIWGNTFAMIADRPLSGHGPGAFLGRYMLYQADYFAGNPDSPYALLADNVRHPFNEYLLLAAEYGLAALLLVLAAAAVVVKSCRKVTAPLLGLLSVGVFACFSYPLSYPFVAVLTAYGLSAIDTKRSRTFPLRLPVKTAVWALATLLGVLLIRDIRFEKDWGRLARQASFGKGDKLAGEYAALHARWNGDPMFLYNYGAVLNHLERYGQSDEIMRQCAGRFNDSDVQLLLGDNLLHLKRYREAEKHLLLARCMCPVRFAPLYRLFLLYTESGQTAKAALTANEILGKPVKIPSATIDYIKREVEKRMGIPNETPHSP